MAVDERSSPQTGDQLRTKNTDKTTANDSSAACEGATASHQPDVCKTVVAAEHVGETTQMGGARTGRGRRKQCRPVRVCFHDDDDNNDDVVAPVEAKPPEVNSLSEVVGLPAQNVCELCGAEETSPEALTAHASTCRGRSDPESNDVTNGGHAFPTPYHELGSELMRCNDNALLQPGDDEQLSTTSTAMPVDCSLAYVDDRAGAARYHDRAEEANDESDVPLDFTLHSDQLASLASSTSASGPTASSVAAMMKQPPETTSSTALSVGADSEDFCEYCQKRFCNKYYLRKHRHDVHGVTASDTQPQPQHLASSFFPQDPLPLLPLTSDALTVHDGFIVTSSSTSAQQLPFQSQMMTSLQPFVLPFQTSTSTTNSLLFQSPPSAADLATSPGAAGLLPGLTSLMLLNPFASSLALLNSPSFLHQTSPAAAAAAYSASSSLNTLAELQKTNTAAAAAVGSGFGGLCDDVAALGALMNPFLPPSDPAAGVTIDDPLSSSHHCELCRKEFCSAYFLAVHRREKHGIATSTALSDAIRLLAAGNGRPGGVLESLGGGGEPGEKLTSTCSSGAAGRVGKSHSDRTSTHAETSRSASSERISNDHVCCLCEKQFPNRYGLVLHLLSAHNIRPEGFGLAGELLQLDGVGGRSQSTASASGKGGIGSGLTSGLSTTSSSSSKQSDRVSCDVCNKEVCNKYFLKTHKMKVHGLDSVAAAVYNPPPPPLDSTRSEAARSPASVSSSSRQHQQQQQHDEMRKALLMADSQFSAFASHLDFALKSASSTDAAGSAGFGVLPPSLQQQQPGEPMMTASDIFRLFGLVGSKQDDPFLSLGPPPPPLSLQSLLPGADLCDPLTDAAKHSKPVELKIPKHVAGMSHHHKDTMSVGMQHQQPGRVKHSAGHHNGRHSRDQAPPPPPQPPGVPRQSQPPAAVGPSDQELIQSGIDPEAYCELCQKEFCSKYFLRTHRQKIHGVSASKNEASLDHYRPLSQQAAAANPVLQMFPGLPLPTQPMFGSGSTGLLPSSSVVDQIPDPVVVNSQGRGSAKETANVTRVTCDVCGKELCNKYFLKTHMAKIHGCTTTPCGRTVELDVGETASDSSEKRAPPESEDDHTSYGSPPYEIYPTASGSLPNLTDHTNIPPLAADNTPTHRPHSLNYLEGTNDFQHGDNSESTISCEKTSSDHSQSTGVDPVGNEAVEHALENGERSLPETNDGRPAKTDAEHVSSNSDTELSLELVVQYDADVGQVRGGKRALTADDGNMKRRRTDCCSDSSTPAADRLTVTGIHADQPETDDHDRSHDATANSSVIQFVSRSKDSVHRPTENSYDLKENVQTESSWSEISVDVAEIFHSANVKQSQLNSSSGGGDYDGQWFTTVNGHADLPRETGSCEPSVFDDQQQPTPPLLQPFVVRQEPLPSSRSSPGTEGPAAESGERTQFAACQLVLPVVRPIRDQLTVEFSVTPVSSD